MIDNKETLSFFPQPVFKYKVDNFKEYNEKLSKYIYDLNKDDKDGISRSNRVVTSKPFNLKDKTNYTSF